MLVDAGTAVRVCVGDGLFVAVFVTGAVAVGSGVIVDVEDLVGVAVLVGVSVAVEVGVSVGVGEPVKTDRCENVWLPPAASVVSQSSALALGCIVEHSHVSGRFVSLRIGVQTFSYQPCMTCAPGEIADQLRVPPAG